MLPQEFGSLVLFEKEQGGIALDVRTMLIDYGGLTRLRTVYDGLQQWVSTQDIKGVSQLINTLVDRIKSEGIKNSRRNNQINVQEMLISKKYKIKYGLSTEVIFEDTFQNEIKRYSSKRFEEDVYSGETFNNIDLVILTGGGANLLEYKIYSQFGQEIWIPKQPETANVRGFYEHLKRTSHSNEFDQGNEKLISEDETFTLGDKVKISEQARAEVNGYDLKNHRNWEGVIIDINKDEIENEVYTIEYPSGDTNLYVSKRDLIKL